MFHKHLKFIAGSMLLTGALVVAHPLTAFAAETVTTQADFSKAVTAHMTNRETSFEIDYAGSDASVNLFLPFMGKALTAGYSANDYLKWSWSTLSPTGRVVASGGTTTAYITVSASYLATKEQEAYSDAALQEAVDSICYNGMTDQAKIKAIHDWVLNKFAYDYSLTNRTPYAGLTTGKFVCQGYALTMYRMLEDAGFNVRIVTGNIPAGYHAWNMVQLDGKWYYIDATNDDVSTDKYRLFLVGSDYLKSKNYTWTASDFPTASTTTYVDTATVEDPALTSATAAVTLAESSPIQANYDSAMTAVNSLSDSADKTSLLLRLSVVKSSMDNVLLNSAKSAVSAAEKSETSLSVASAREAVSGLNDGTDKTSLTSRLDAVDLIIASYGANTATAMHSVQALVRTAETSSTSSNYTAAYSAVSSLADCSAKTDLLKKLTVVKNKIDSTMVPTPVNDPAVIAAATKAVVSAEIYKRADYVSKAYAAVNVLKDSSEKSALTSRVSAVESAIYQTLVTQATAAVLTAETSKTTNNLTTAQTLVSKLVNGDVKTSLQARLDTVGKTTNTSTAIAQAETYVKAAEKAKTASSLTIAKNTVNSLYDSSEKTAFLKRISNVQTAINTTIVKTASTAVTAAEKSNTQTALDKAQSLVDAIPDGIDKTALQTRLNKVKSIIESYGNNTATNITRAITMVSMAEKGNVPTYSYYISAVNYIKALNDCQLKTDLTARIEVVHEKIQSYYLKAVDADLIKAQSTMRIRYLSEARQFMAYISDCAEKAALAGRITILSALTGWK